MQLDLSVRHGSISEESQNKLKSKAEKLGRYFERLMAIEIIVDLKDPKGPQVEIKVSAEHKHDFVAHSTSENLYQAADTAVQKIEQQLKKYKQKVQQRHRNSNHKKEMLAESNPAEETLHDED